MLDVICENCGIKFKLVKVFTRNIGKGLVESYFTCPVCGKDYHVCFTDKEIRLMMKTLDKSLKQVVKLANGNKPIPNDLSQKVLNLRQEIKRQMDILNGK